MYMHTSSTWQEENLLFSGRQRHCYPPTASGSPSTHHNERLQSEQEIEGAYSEEFPRFSEERLLKVIFIDVSLANPQSHEHLTCIVHRSPAMRY